ncbi:DUF4870 domain-containing protein [Hazenella coriacea]|uniref:DUF4870 domain-containing protein n=1 Tax=Hazenella coriacea TaxID=1179467 RepID=A0A4R3LCD6_9BACL|nr:DUF4870 domain-containing protein [Hazenella coriacea]TCS95106.1 hypothetical protein EDD58_103532 [Hazenella coriacea]
MDTKWIKVLIHASTWFAPILVPIIVYLVADDRDIKKLSLQALIFHLSMVVLLAISSVLTIILIGFLLIFIFTLISIIIPIMGIIYALQDRTFNYPVIGQFIS